MGVFVPLFDPTAWANSVVYFESVMSVTKSRMYALSVLKAALTPSVTEKRIEKLNSPAVAIGAMVNTWEFAPVPCVSEATLVPETTMFVPDKVAGEMGAADHVTDSPSGSVAAPVAVVLVTPSIGSCQPLVFSAPPVIVTVTELS